MISGHINTLKKANQILICPLVVPAGIEPASSESESEILSIVLRNHFLLTCLQKYDKASNFLMTARLLHQDLLSRIADNSGHPTQHTFLDSYLGNTHPRYPISVPKLRKVTKNWLTHQPISDPKFISLLTRLIKGKSSTEKMAAGFLIDYGKKHLDSFDVFIYEEWLEYAEGWAEVDTLCYGHFKADEILSQWQVWKTLLVKLNSSKNINKRRASLVLLCQPLHCHRSKKLLRLAFSLVRSLQREREGLITKAVSWTLRSMVKHHRPELVAFF